MGNQGGVSGPCSNSCSISILMAGEQHFFFTDLRRWSRVGRSRASTKLLKWRARACVLVNVLVFFLSICCIYSTKGCCEDQTNLARTVSSVNQSSLFTGKMMMWKESALSHRPS